jgi:hypothetical protein
MADFPTIAGGCVTQLPFATVTRFVTMRNDMPSGPRHSYYERATKLKRWELSFPVLSDTSLGTLKTFYLTTVRGGWDSFDFTDPNDSVEYTPCRFADESFTWTSEEKDKHSARMVIEETD